MQRNDRAPFSPRRGAAWTFALSVLALSAVAWTQLPPVGTTLADFEQPGSQPLSLQNPIVPSGSCSGCHSGYDVDEEPYTRWAASMMAQSGRDPIFYAALAIANQDAADSGEFCLRCHAPGAWLDGRSTPTDGSALDPQLGDLDGVTCNLCHRLVDPIANPGVNPPEDDAILAALAQVPPTPHNGQYIVDPQDRRRGPYDLGPSFFFHDWIQSPHHRESQLCGTCHDVSNPTLSKQIDGSYQLNATNAPHPTHVKAEEFPIERTFTEWTLSQYAQAPVEHFGRFGGNKPYVQSCQDCHMPKTEGVGCQPVLGSPVRNDLPLHDFNGVNSWVLNSVRANYPDLETGLTTASVHAAQQRTIAMQQKALDLETWVDAGQLRVRIVNQTGHKLPTGYSEGRRMWINVQFFDAGNQLVAERGNYDYASATLTMGDTKVYEADLGIDAQQALATGKPAGSSFHFVLNNTVLKDNRVPPRGFTNAAFALGQSEPIAASYADEQYWDDTLYAIPGTAVSAVVNVFHQTTTKEYIEFLRNENTTNGAGQFAYDEWVAHGKSAPVLKQSEVISLVASSCPPPIQYGLAKKLSNGRRPGLSWTGTPSVSGPGFRLVVRNGLPRSFGIVQWSSAMHSVPFKGGTLLIAPPLTTLASFQLDDTGQQLVTVPLSPSLVGVARNFQAFFRDRAAPEKYGITNAVHVDFCP